MSAGDAAEAPREPESPRASAPATRDVQVAAERESPTHARASDAVRREAESKDFGGDGERFAVPEHEIQRAVSELEARRAVPETGEAASPYAQAAVPDALDASPQTFQTEDASAASSEDRRGRVARVREGTRARVENTRARVERVKGDALVALEEAPDDSGLRFVAVAVVLFVLFLAFLLLSVTVLR